MENKTDFDKYYVRPLYGVSEVNSRTLPSLHSPHLYNLFPIISSPMSWLGNPRFVIEMANSNCLGILHRFTTFEGRIDAIKRVSDSTNMFGVAVGINDLNTEYDIAAYAKKRGAKAIVIDVANGYLKSVHEFASYLKYTFKYDVVIAGNVIEYAGKSALCRSGVDLVRVGIGNGGNCQTRTVTGVGRNQLMAVRDCSRDGKPDVISDGGMKSSGDLVKSFSAGATYVMLGTMLAHAEEAEHDGILYGMASLRNHLETGKEVKTIEGFETNLDKERKPLSTILNEIMFGVKSACTYFGSFNYQEIKSRSVLINADNE